jgi:hypothetical protein
MRHPRRLTFIAALSAGLLAVYGSETPGITTLTVTGRGTAHCSTGIVDGQVFTPGTLPVTLSGQTERAPAGQVQDPLAVELGEELLGTGDFTVVVK